MPDIDFPRVRRSNVCVLCFGPKQTGLVICWHCNGIEKRKNDGTWSDKALAWIGAYENLLSVPDQEITT